MMLTSVVDPLILEQMDDKRLRLFQAAVQQQILENKELRASLAKLAEQYRKK
jgi:hypothetical protein